MNWTYHDRHWMHIWKVGYKPCANCSRDSRVVASLLDPQGEVVEQKLLCEIHGPWKGLSGRGQKNTSDSVSRINLELGGSFTLNQTHNSDKGNN